MAPSQFLDLADIDISFRQAGGDFLVAFHRDHLVAMGGIRPASEVRVEVLRVRVHPAIRRRGIGRMVMSALERRAVELGFQETFLDTTTNQPEALAFYRGIGYSEVGRAHQADWSWVLVYLVKNLFQPRDVQPDPGSEP